MDEIMYCENDQCRTVVYHTVPVADTQGKNVGELLPDEACPTCRRFGRKEGKN